jgi:hypothetical protein
VALIVPSGAFLYRTLAQGGSHACTAPDRQNDAPKPVIRARGLGRKASSGRWSVRGVKRLTSHPESWQIDKTRFRYSLAGCTVTIHEHLDGTISIRYGPHVIGQFEADGERRGSAKPLSLKSKRQATRAA